MNPLVLTQWILVDAPGRKAGRMIAPSDEAEPWHKAPGQFDLGAKQRVGIDAAHQSNRQNGVRSEHRCAWCAVFVKVP